MNPSRTAYTPNHLQSSNSLKDDATRRMNIRRISEEDEEQNVASNVARQRALVTIPARITSRNSKSSRENHDHLMFICSDSDVESILKAAYEVMEK